MHTCMMCTSLYVKANGDIPCWDDVGESHILRRFTISASDLATEPLFHSPGCRLESFQDANPRMVGRGNLEQSDR